MDNRSQPEPDSHKRETDLKVHQASCLLHLRSSVLRWGIRKRVSYVSRKLKVVKPRMSLRVDSESESKVEGERSLKHGVAASEAEERSLSVVKSLSGGKKKRGDNSGDSERRLSKKIAGRWSVQRCESAKMALLEVVKEMDATWQNPVLRYDLRAKARKYIGDTGLLDHLLRHMAGQVFPDGKERLVRRHNSEGAIQYWLEPAELAGIRQEAGISDPYWIPRPGWKLGDAILDHMCDGQCNEQINFLKIEIAELKETAWSEITELKETLKNQQEEICLLKEENEKRRKDKLTVTVKETCIASRENLVQEKAMAKQVVADDEASATEKTAQKSAFRICQPEGTFLWPDMASTRETSFYPHCVPSAASLSPQHVVLPSPTSPLPPRLQAFFCQPQPDNNTRVHRFSQAQSKGVLVPSPGQGMIQWPTTRYASLPHEMMNSGPNASNRAECGALTLLMAPAMNSGKTDGVMTDLTLGSYNY